jgi:hypothetical protein
MNERHEDDNGPARSLLTLEQLYTSTPKGEQFEQEREQSLHPHTRDMLLDMVREAGLPPKPKIVDVGCG